MICYTKLKRVDLLEGNSKATFLGCASSSLKQELLRSSSGKVALVCVRGIGNGLLLGTASRKGSVAIKREETTAL